MFIQKLKVDILPFILGYKITLGTSILFLEDMVLSRMIYFSMQKACLHFMWKNPVDRSVLPTTFFRSPMNVIA